MKKLYIALTTVVICTYQIKAQYIINTFAGTGTAGYSGDGGIPTLAELDGPGGVDLDASGNLYIADKYNERVRKVSGGIITTFAGNGTPGFLGDGGLATSAELHYPTAVAVGKTIANVYITDYANQRVRLVTPSLTISTFAGIGTQGFSGDGGLATACEFYNPYEIAVDNAGNVYICDRYNHRLRKVDGTGNITTIAGDGTPSFGGDGGAATSASLNYPSAVYIDAFNNIYIADQGNHRIRKITGGIITTIAGTGTAGYGGDGGPATSADLYNPHGVFVDNTGSIYIADSDNNRVRKISPGGIITTIAGNGTPGYSGDGGLATLAQLTYPTKIAVNNLGKVYIADYNNNVVRILTNTMDINENSNNQELQVYPNPTAGQVNIVASGHLNLQGTELVTITNTLGEILLQKEVILEPGSPCNVDITEMPAGIYFVHAGNFTQRIIKQ